MQDVCLELTPAPAITAACPAVVTKTLLPSLHTCICSALAWFEVKLSQDRVPRHRGWLEKPSAELVLESLSLTGKRVCVALLGDPQELSSWLLPPAVVPFVSSSWSRTFGEPHVGASCFRSPEEGMRPGVLC